MGGIGLTRLGQPGPSWLPKHLTDEQLLEQMKELGGLPAELQQDRTLMGLVLPAMLADLRLVDGCC